MCFQQKTKNPGRKRQRLEAYSDSRTVTKLIDLIGHGRMSVTGAVDLANCMVDDGMLKDAITAFASLGTNMAHASNCERDLHRWFRDLFGFRLQPYCVDMFLQVTQLLLEIRCSPNLKGT